MKSKESKKLADLPLNAEEVVKADKCEKIKGGRRRRRRSCCTRNMWVRN